MRKARRSAQYAAAAAHVASETVVAKVGGGMQRRLKMSAFSSANTPVLLASPLAGSSRSPLAISAPSAPAVKAPAVVESTVLVWGPAPPPRSGLLTMPPAGTG